MRRITRHRARPDNMRTEVRAAKRGRAARYLYLGLLGVFALLLVNTLIGELLALQGSGMVTRKASVVTPAYNGTVEALAVDEGDTVNAGAEVAELTSRQMRERLTEIRSRLDTARADRATAEAEVARLRDLLEPARRELARARDHRERLEALRDQGLATNGQGVTVAQAVYSARKEVQTLKSKLTAARERLSVQQEAVKRAETALADARDRFAGGVLATAKGGLVTDVAVREGAFVEQGDPVVEVMHGEAHVLAYLPVGAAYDIDTGDDVVLRYGMRTMTGEITDLKPVARRLPAEFQQVFHAAERERLVRIDLPSDVEMPPLFTKLAVTGPWALRTMLARFVMTAYRVSEMTMLYVARFAGDVVDKVREIAGLRRSGSSETARKDNYDERDVEP